MPSKFESPLDILQNYFYPLYFFMGQFINELSIYFKDITIFNIIEDYSICILLLELYYIFYHYSWIIKLWMLSNLLLVLFHIYIDIGFSYILSDSYQNNIIEDSNLLKNIGMIVIVFGIFIILFSGIPSRFYILLLSYLIYRTIQNIFL
jgi:hypothetical protein